MESKTTIKQLQKEGEKSLQQAAAQPWVGWLTRLGYAVNGFLYILIGFLAIQVAFGGRGRLVDHTGALKAIAAEPLGEILLMVIAVGLVGSILWSIIRAWLDPYRAGNGVRGIFTRVGYLVSSISYGALLLPTLQTLFHAPVRGGEEGAEQVSASILATDYGPWLLTAVGLAVCGVGIVQILVTTRRDFGMQFDRYQLTPQQEKWIQHIGRFGSAARGVVFVEIGILTVYAALTVDPEKVDGIDGALLVFAQQSYGMVLLGVIAAGLIAFGLYSLLGAAWFHIKQT
ncbi:MAG TPA: DUF1206 domain-containing protein [Anaerolineaceae bacterium]|nr:DUF1206 domain-containing protein [Anaerolineaceae bacterium]